VSRRVCSSLQWLWPLLLALSSGMLQAQPVLTLGQGFEPRDLSGYLALAVDDTAAWGLDDVLQREALVAPLRRQQLNQGYSASAFWLRLRVHNAGTSPLRRYLQMAPARLEEVTLYAGSDGRRWQRRDAGLHQPFAARQLLFRDSTFLIELAPGETQQLWLRVASRGAISLRPSLWEPRLLESEAQQRMLFDGVLFGMMILLGLTALVLGIALRELAYGYVAAYVLFYVLYESGMKGSAFMLLWPQATDWALRSLSTLGGLSLLAHWLALSRLLQTARREPLLHRILQGLVLLSLGCLSLCVAGDYRLGSILINQINALIFIGLTAISIRAWLARLPLAAPWVFLLIASELGVLPRWAELQGLIPNSVLTEYGPPLGGLFGSALVLLAMVRRLLRQRARHALRLEHAVRLRTRELAEATQRAEASDAAKGRLLGYLGHDLRAPLASMVNLTRMLQPGRDFEGSRRAIERSSLMALEMIDEMEQFARFPQSSAALEIVPAPLYLQGLLAEIVDQAQALARSGGNHLALRMDAGLPAVVVLDARRLRQVLVNLLANAAKFTRDGQIHLEARVVGAGSGLELAVRDDGPGIAPAELAHVFTAFMRGRSEGHTPGMGLGLSIAKQLVESMGGTISVASRPGLGACFMVRLPLQEARESEVMWPSTRPWMADSLGLGRAVLLLEPCGSARAALSERLLLAGFDCVEAASLDEAARALSRQSFDLLVAEPEADAGFAPALARWQRSAPGMVVLLCGRRQEGFARHETTALCLLKPAPEGQWWAALAELLSGQPA
jgi:two-component system, sensor histidine kinase LadS